MNIKKLRNRIRRLALLKSKSAKKIKYLREQGVKIGEGCHVDTLGFPSEPYLIEIGDHVGIASGTLFLTHDAGINCFREEFPEDDVFGTIKIGNNVFIGSNCIILLNSNIGNNCIVGAGSVVRGTFPDNSVIFGNPAKVVMKMGAQRMLYKLNKGRLPTVKMTDPQKKPQVLKHFNLP